MIDPHLPNIEEWVVRPNGKIRADVVAEKLAAVGFHGSERTLRRAVAAVKSNYRAGRRRVFRPRIPEPGIWAPWDWVQGPRACNSCPRTAPGNRARSRPGPPAR